jgi:hypothetical protein
MGLDSWTLFFLLYINDLPAIINDVSKPTLFADDISLILTTADHKELKESFAAALGKIMHWFQTNFFTLNINKTYCMYFTTKMSQNVNSPVKYINTQINSTHCIDFLGLTMDSALFCQEHINKVTRKLNSACFVIRSLKSVLTIDDLKIVYYAYVHSIITYGIVFWGNTTNSSQVL